LPLTISSYSAPVFNAAVCCSSDQQQLIIVQFNTFLSAQQQQLIVVQFQHMQRRSHMHRNLSYRLNRSA
jgi:hypothetical protein